MMDDDRRIWPRVCVIWNRPTAEGQSAVLTATAGLAYTVSHEAVTIFSSEILAMQMPDGRTTTIRWEYIVEAWVEEHHHKLERPPK
jgi:hypothetical protein